MKKLTKEQLANLVHDNCKKIVDLNMNGIMERMSELVKESSDYDELLVNLVVVYGAEIMDECNQVLTETLYDILYTE